MKTTAVVILNWNGKHFLERFLPSVLAYSNQPGVSIVVADNGSTDESLSFLQQQYPQVRLISLDQNYGFTGGYNRSLAQVNADYYLLLNSDIEVTENWLTPLLNLMERDSDVAVCMPKIRSYDRREYFEYAGAAGGFIDKYGYPFCRGRILSHIEKDEGQYDSVHEIFWATGACMLVRADLYWELGGLDEDFFAHMEEIDFCWRAKNHGYKVMCCPTSVVYHVGGGTLPINTPRKLFLNYRNNLFMLHKNVAHTHRSVIFVRMCLDGLSALSYLFSGKISFFKMVLLAHKEFWQYRSSKKIKKANMPVRELPCMYRRSIIWKFYIRGKRKLKFSDIAKDL